MKTLVIHPKDSTTDFLSDIYSDKKEWTILNYELSRVETKRLIREHDRVVILGHGDERGLYGYGYYVVNSSMTYVLRSKQVVCIWCNTVNFVHRYGLRGFYTGMVISETLEANMYKINSTNYDVDESNSLLAQVIKRTIDSEKMLENTLELYKSETNPIIQFNRKNLFYRK